MLLALFFRAQIHTHNIRYTVWICVRDDNSGTCVSRQARCVRVLQRTLTFTNFFTRQIAKTSLFVSERAGKTEKVRVRTSTLLLGHRSIAGCIVSDSVCDTRVIPESQEIINTKCTRFSRFYANKTHFCELSQSLSRRESHARLREDPFSVFLDSI